MDAGNVVLKSDAGRITEHFSSANLPYCFSELTEHHLPGLHTPMDEVCRLGTDSPKKGSIRGAAGPSGHDKRRYVGG